LGARIVINPSRIETENTVADIRGAMQGVKTIDAIFKNTVLEYCGRTGGWSITLRSINSPPVA
jgi:hypothetical protein